MLKKSDKSAGKKPTEKTERIAVYLTSEQMSRLDKYSQKRLGEPKASAATVRAILFHYLDEQGF